jgi:hypothetical protein
LSPYQFLAGFLGVQALKEHLVYRRIQTKKHLSVEEAKRISEDFTQMPRGLKRDLTAYIDDLLLPIQSENGTVQKTQVDLISACTNIVSRFDSQLVKPSKKAARFAPFSGEATGKHLPLVIY